MRVRRRRVRAACGTARGYMSTTVALEALLLPTGRQSQQSCFFFLFFFFKHTSGDKENAPSFLCFNDRRSEDEREEHPRSPRAANSRRRAPVRNVHSSIWRATNESFDSTRRFYSNDDDAVTPDYRAHLFLITVTARNRKRPRRSTTPARTCSPTRASPCLSCFPSGRHVSSKSEL